MSTKKKIDQEAGEDVGAYAHCGPWADALRLWRTVPADGFGPAERAAVAECMQRTSFTIDGWGEAIGCDAPSAIRLVLRMERPQAITASIDLTMTVLLNAALAGSAGAALALSHALRRMPLDDVKRRRLATSWLVLNIRQAFPEGGPAGARRRPGRCDARIAPRSEGEGRS
jgi:hypothetical protein